LRNSAKQVFAGGWKKIASANHTTNLSPVFSLLDSFFIHPDGTMIFLLIGTNVEVRNYSIAHNVDTIGGVIATFPITVDINPRSICFSQNGNIMLISGKDNKLLFSYTLPIFYDVNSIVDAPVTMSLSMTGNGSLHCMFSRDGDYVFVADQGRLLSFPLPTNFLITSNTTNTNLSIFNLIGVGIKPEGDLLYVTIGSSNLIQQYKLPSPNIIVGGILENSIDFGVDIPGQICLRSNGDEMVIDDIINNELEKFQFGESWDLSTVSLHKNDEPIPTPNPRAISWKPDGTKYIIADFGDKIITEYNVAHPFNQTGATPGSSFPLNGIQNNVTGMYIDNAGDYCYIVGSQGSDRVNRLDMTTGWDVSTMFDSTVSVPIPNVGVLTGICMNHTKTRFYLSNNQAPTHTLVQFDMPPPLLSSDPADIVNAVFAGSVDVTANSDVPQDLVLSPDERHAFVPSLTLNHVARYILSTPGDITTAVFVDALNTAATENNIFGLFIRRHDGKKLYVIGTTMLKVVSYDVA